MPSYASPAFRCIADNRKVLKPRDALEGKGPQRRPQQRVDRRWEEVAKAVGGGYWRLQMPLRLARAVRETVAGHGQGALEGGGGGYLPPPSNAPLLDPHPPARDFRRLDGPSPPPPGASSSLVAPWASNTAETKLRNVSAARSLPEYPVHLWTCDDPFCAFSTRFLYRQCAPHSVSGALILFLRRQHMISLHKRQA